MRELEYNMELTVRGFNHLTRQGYDLNKRAGIAEKKVKKLKKVEEMLD